MYVAVENSIYAQLIEKGHVAEADVGEFRRTHVVVVDVAVHTDHIPGLCGCLDIAAHPVRLLLNYSCLEGVQLMPYCGQHDEMNGPVVEGTIKTRKFAAAVAGNIKIVEVCVGPAEIPVQVVGFVVPHKGSQGKMLLDTVHGGEPVVPVLTAFAVVHQVSEKQKKVRVMIAKGSRQSDTPPCDVAVLALGVGGDYGLAACSVICFKGIPAACLFPFHDAVFVLLPGSQPCDLRGVEYERCAVINEVVCRGLYAVLGGGSCLTPYCVDIPSVFV